MTEWVEAAVIAVLVSVPTVKAWRGHRSAQKRLTEEWIAYLEEDLASTR